MSHADTLPAGDGRFPTTSWRFIRVVQDRDHPEHRDAANRFVTLYWKPVFYFLRAHRLPFHDAQDATQEFLIRFLGPDALGRAVEGRGRFRSFLLGVLKHFLSDRGPQRAPRPVVFERGFVRVSELVGDEERAYEPAADETPDAVFDRQWAAGVWETVRRQLRERYAQEGRLAWYDLFIAYSAPEGKRPSQEALAERFGLSRDQVRDILDKVRKRWERLLRAEVREQVGSEADVDDEMRELLRLLGR